MISIIVPVYNAEDYLERCIQSILDQTYKEIEVLLIDDGSRDSSKKICDRYAVSDSRIRVFSQANQGPAAARNLGLEHASGEYVTFVDADDWIKPTMYECMVTAMDGYEQDVDMVLCGFEYYKEGKTWSINQGILPGYYEGEALRQITLDFIASSYERRIRPFLWIRMIRRELLNQNNIRFDKNLKRSEDFLFLTQVHLCITTMVAVTDRRMYIYNQNMKSISHSYVEGYPEMVLYIYNHLHPIIEKKHDSQMIEKLYYFLVYRGQVIISNECWADFSLIKKRKRIDLYLRTPEFSNAVTHINLKDGIHQFGFSYVLMRFRLSLILSLYFKIKYGRL